MAFKFKVGDKVKLLEHPYLPHLIGEEAVVTGLGGKATPDKGAVITNDKFPCGELEYGEHGMWVSDDFLDLV